MSAKRKMGLVTPSSWIREKGREIICPEGAQIVIKPDGTREIRCLTESKQNDFLSGFIAGIAFIAFLGMLATAVLNFVGALGARRC